MTLVALRGVDAMSPNQSARIEALCDEITKPDNTGTLGGGGGALAVNLAADNIHALVESARKYSPHPVA